MSEEDQNRIDKQNEKCRLRNIERDVAVPIDIVHRIESSLSKSASKTRAKYTCSETDCENQAISLGLCIRHGVATRENQDDQDCSCCVWL